MLRCAPKLLDNPINSLPILEVDVIIWMFCFASSMTLKFICIDHLQNKLISQVGQKIVLKTSFNTTTQYPKTLVKLISLLGGTNTEQAYLSEVT